MYWRERNKSVIPTIGLNMQIIDAHHHLWCPVNDKLGIDYVWLKNIGAIKPFGDPTAIQCDYLVEEFATESSRHEVIGSVHLQCDGAIPDPVKESQWIEAVKRDHNLPSVHVGFIDLTLDDVELQLERYFELPGFRGVRQILSRLEGRPELSFAAEHYLRNPTWRKQYPLLAKHHLTFDCQLYPEQMVEAAAFFSLHPDIPVIIDHAGSPHDQSPDGLVTLKYGLRVLAKLPHCHIKLCGFGMFDQAWTDESIDEIFKIILDEFGPERMLFGSNFPVDKLMRSYDFIIDSLISCCETNEVSDENQQKIFNGNARNFYRLAR